MQRLALLQLQPTEELFGLSVFNTCVARTIPSDLPLLSTLVLCIPQVNSLTKYPGYCVSPGVFRTYFSFENGEITANQWILEKQNIVDALTELTKPTNCLLNEAHSTGYLDSTLLAGAKCTTSTSF